MTSWSQAVEPKTFFLFYRMSKRLHIIIWSFLAINMLVIFPVKMLSLILTTSWCYDTAYWVCWHTASVLVACSEKYLLVFCLCIFLNIASCQVYQVLSHSCPVFCVKSRNTLPSQILLLLSTQLIKHTYCRSKLIINHDKMTQASPSGKLFSRVNFIIRVKHFLSPELLVLNEQRVGFASLGIVVSSNVCFCNFITLFVSQRLLAPRVVSLGEVPL